MIEASSSDHLQSEFDEVEFRKRKRAKKTKTYGLNTYLLKNKHGTYYETMSCLSFLFERGNQ
jgi:hypothetical protein